MSDSCKTPEEVHEALLAIARFLGRKLAREHYAEEMRLAGEWRGEASMNDPGAGIETPPDPAAETSPKRRARPRGKR